MATHHKSCSREGCKSSTSTTCRFRAITKQSFESAPFMGAFNQCLWDGTSSFYGKAASICVAFDEGTEDCTVDCLIGGFLQLTF